MTDQTQLLREAQMLIAWHELRSVDAKSCALFNSRKDLQEIAAGHDNAASTIRGLIAALSAPAQPASGEAVKTTGHCENRKQKGGCHLHNLHCGYPKCDERYEQPQATEDEPQATPIPCAVYVAGRTFGKGTPFCDVIDHVEAARKSLIDEKRVAWAPYLVDRADGVKGRYAIGRWNPRGYREVWNLHTRRWAAYSDDVMSLEEADSLLRLIVIPTARVTPPASQEQAQPAQCDGGTCGLGGYCDKCPKQAQPSMKDGEIAALVNKLRDIAMEFHGQQQLRERIAGLIVPALKAAQPSGEVVAWRDHVEQRLHSWRQRTMNKSGDCLALDDFMGQDSIDDLIDYVCSVYEGPTDTAPQPAQPAARVAMSDDELWITWNEQGVDDMDKSAAFAFARAVEAHHGITSNGANDA
jgi:hypothetical protein